MTRFRQRTSQGIAILSTVIALSSFPIHKPLAEEIPKKPVAAEQTAKKQEQGTLKLSTNSCKTGESVFVDVVNSKGEQIRGETVKVISPTGKEYEVLISNELNGFVPENTGHYKFVYGTQEQVICVTPSGFKKIPTISLEEIGDLSGEEAYLLNRPPAIISLKSVEKPYDKAKVYFYDCTIVLFGGTCEELVSGDFRNTLPKSDYDDLIKKIKNATPSYKGPTLLLIQHALSVSVIDLTSLTFDAFKSGLLVFHNSLDLSLIAKISDTNPNLILFRLVTLNKDKKPLDGGLVVDVEFNSTLNTGSVKGYDVIHDNSLCPLSTSPKN